jgi:hypothetical protein
MRLKIFLSLVRGKRPAGSRPGLLESMFGPYVGHIPGLDELSPAEQSQALDVLAKSHMLFQVVFVGATLAFVAFHLVVG